MKERQLKRLQSLKIQVFNKQQIANVQDNSQIGVPGLTVNSYIEILERF